MTRARSAIRPSLEGLVEAGMVKLESLHPGGLDMTREPARLCNIRKGSKLLDVASVTGETACFLSRGMSRYLSLAFRCPDRKNGAHRLHSKAVPKVQCG